ncbi:MAG: response regulator [Magnetococcales bacterium]|nr:response regulator [Magnetococcales bacterium]
MTINNQYRQFLLLVLIMITVTVTATAFSLIMLYKSSIKTEENQLQQLSKSQVSLIRAMYSFESETHGDSYPGGAIDGTVKNTIAALNKQKGFGQTGEFVLGQINGDKIEFLVKSRLMQKRLPSLPLEGPLARPMQLALAGQSGLITELDYRSVKVLAAYQAIPELNIGLVCKIDIDEIHAPFINSALLATFIALFTLGLGLLLLWQVESTSQLRDEFSFFLGKGREISRLERVFYLLLVMSLVTIATTTTANLLLYRTSYSDSESFLAEMVASQKRIIDQYENELLTDPSLEAKSETLARFVEAYETGNGFGNSGEFVMGRLNGRNIEFLLKSTITGMPVPPIFISSEAAGPMRMALSGFQGVRADKDYRSEDVLAAYAPLDILDTGLVAKIDLAELQEPFMTSGIRTMGFTLVMIVIGSLFMARKMENAVVKSNSGEIKSNRFIQSDGHKEVPFSLIILSVWMALAVTALDLAMPLGVAGGVPFTALVLLGGWYPKRSHIIWLAVVATVLTVVGYLASTPGLESWMALTNRIYALFTIWATALTLSLAKASELEIFRQTSELQKLSSALEQSPSAVIITDPMGNIEFVNLHFTVMTGYTFNEAQGQNLRILKSELQDPHLYEALWQQVNIGKSWQGEMINKTKSGRDFWSSVSINSLCDKDGTIRYFVCVQHDISSLKETEKQLFQANRDLNTRLLFSEILKIAVDKNKALEKLCQVLVEDAGYEMAWVGFIEKDGSKRVFPVAAYGENAKDYLDGLIVSWDDSSPFGNGPTGLAARTGQLKIISSTQNDSSYKPWQSEATNKGFLSSIAIPLTDNNTPFGVLNIYSSKQDTFDETESRLLTALSQQMADGILRLRETRLRHQAEVAMKESEQRFRTLFNAMTSGVAIYQSVDDGNDFIFSDINKSGLRIARILDSIPLTGRRVKEVLPLVEESGLLQVFQHVYRTGKSILHPICRYQDDQLQSWLEYNVFQLESGEVVSIFDDLTTKKQDEYRLRLAHASLENSLDMVLWVLPDGKFSGVNQATCDRLGYSRDKLMSMSAFDLNPVHFGEAWYLHWAELKEKGSLTFEADLICFNASPLAVEISANYLEFDHQEYNVAIVRDISERRIMEMELRKSEELAHKANQTKGEFLAKMSHEIRTPMNSIIGMCYLANQTGLSKRQERYLNKIEMASKSLLRLINDILDFSKIDAGKLELEQVPFSLAEVMERVVDTLQIRGDISKKLEILVSYSIDVPVHLVGDPIRVEQVLINLGTNAVKFTQDGEIVFSIKLEACEDDEILLIFTIEDTGIGISKDKIGDLFLAFQQSDNSITREYGGTGLGLSICKSLVEMMGGKISIESQPNVGTCVSFNARFGRHSDHEELTFALPDNLLQQRVLLVDDNKRSREILRGLLDALQLSYQSVDSGLGGIQALQKGIHAETSFDVVLLDWDESGNMGDFTKSALSASGIYPIPSLVIMGSEFHESKIVSWLEKSGLEKASFLPKPIMPHTLLRSLTSLHNEVVEAVVEEELEPADEFAFLQGLCILLVDDMQENQELIQEILERKGAVVSIATDGHKAVEMVNQSVNGFDLVLMDMQMPVMDGLEATRQIRSQERFQSLPIIALSASAMMDEINRCLEAGMNDHLGKPIDVQQLLDTILKWINREADLPLPNTQFSENTDFATQVTPSSPIDVVYPHLDINKGLNRCQGDLTLYAKLLNRLITNSQDLPESIEELLNNNDFESASRLVHNLKNISGNISSLEVFSIAEELELTLYHRDSEGVFSLLPGLRKALDIAAASCQMFLEKQQMDKYNEDLLDKKELLLVIEELAGMLKTRDLGVISKFEKVKTTLQTLLPQDGYLDKLEFYMHQLQVEEASEELARVIDLIKRQDKEDRSNQTG